MDTPRPGDLDLKSMANVRDPFPVYAWLRARDPVHWSKSLNAWVISRYADVREVFERPEDFSSDRFRRLAPDYASDRPAVRAVAEVLGHWLVFRDPPDHTRLRGLLQKTFTPRQLEKSRESVQAVLDDLLSEISGEPESDFIRDVAFPLPASVIALLLGVPTEDLAAIKLWSDRLASYLGGAVDGSDNFSEAEAGVQGLVEYFQKLLSERRAAPRDDLMSLMLQAEHEGDRLSPDEVVANALLLLFAGHETTTNLLGNGLFHLLRHPEELAELRRDPSLTPSAVEEFLRYDGPVPATIKVATRDLTWRGRDIRAGDMVMPFMSSANRDPERFHAPDVLDIRRQRKRHLAFAYGLHFCLGAPLARLEAQIVFDTLLRGFPNLRALESEAQWKPMIFLRGLVSLPIAW